MAQNPSSRQREEETSPPVIRARDALHTPLASHVEFRAMAAIASVGTPTLRFGAVRSATKATVARAPLGACLTPRTIRPERRMS